MIKYFWVKTNGEVKEVKKYKEIRALRASSKGRYKHRLLRADKTDIYFINFSYVRWSVLDKIRAIVKGAATK